MLRSHAVTLCFGQYIKGCSCMSRLSLVSLTKPQEEFYNLDGLQQACTDTMVFTFSVDPLNF